ncbi:MAG: hypothetical protein QM487_02815 [Candidatus Marithrix sp.]
MSHLPAEEVRFSANVTVLGQLIKECINKLQIEGKTELNPGIVQMAVGLLALFDKDELITKFIKNSHEKYWDMIKARNISFFTEHANEIFGNLPMQNVNLFKCLFEKDEHGNILIGDDDISNMWRNFDSLVKISIKYAHKYSKPSSVKNDDGQLVNQYGTNFISDPDQPKIDLFRHAEVWNIKLGFPVAE